MIQAQHNSLHKSIFDVYIKRKLKAHFQRIKLIDCGLQLSNTAILGLGNHISWWDGFWMYNLNEAMLNKRFHILMLEEQLKTRPFFSRLGAFGITPKSRDIVQGLRYCSNILEDQKNSVFYFPEGEIRPMAQASLTFEKGILKVIQQTHTPINLLLVVNQVEYFSHAKPTLYTFYKTIDSAPLSTIHQLEDAYNSFLMDCRTKLNFLL